MKPFEPITSERTKRTITRINAMCKQCNSVREKIAIFVEYLNEYSYLVTMVNHEKQYIAFRSKRKNAQRIILNFK
jgi:phenylpyruvate tautomerase PptA (4-oxalocrotonate tautomerase family)